MKTINDKIDEEGGNVRLEVFLRLVHEHLTETDEIIKELISFVPPELMLTSKIKAIRDFYKEEKDVETV